MTLHVHKVDYSKPNNSRLRLSVSNVDGMGEFLEVPVGWQIAAGDEEDRRVCESHDWGCEFLFFANGERCGTEQHRSKLLEINRSRISVTLGNLFPAEMNAYEHSLASVAFDASERERRFRESRYRLEWDGEKVKCLGGDVLLTKSN